MYITLGKIKKKKRKKIFIQLLRQQSRNRSNETSCFTYSIRKTKRIDEHVAFPFLCSSALISYLFAIIIAMPRTKQNNEE